MDEISLDPELLRRYDRPGPCYASYPTTPHFTDSFGEAEFRRYALGSNAEPIPRQLSLYLHVPDCFSSGAYVERLVREIETVAKLFDRDRDVIQLHLGGGAPNFPGAAEVNELISSLGRQFHFSTSSTRDFSIDLDPRVIRPGDVAACAALGFNRASLAIRNFDPAVRCAVNDEQSVDQTMQVIADCRDSGFRSVNVDLVYGLPRQTLAGFGHTLEAILEARPDRVATYGYAHLPEVLEAQRRSRAIELPDAETRIGLLCLAIERLSAAGYRYIGMDQFALPGDDLVRAREAGRLQRNFMGYTTHADSDLIGLGVSAMSHVGDSYSQNPPDLAAWEAAVDQGRLPVWRGIELDGDDVLRADAIQELMCRGEVDIAGFEYRHRVDFPAYFADTLEGLQPLVANGLVRIDRDVIAATSHGRLLLRIIAMCFDRYLTSSQTGARTRYSRVI